MNHRNLDALAGKVRAASLAGELTRLRDISGERDEEYRDLTAALAAGEITDIRLIQEQEEIYLFSDRYMTRAYARASVLAATGDISRLIAETVRSDSATYPRPTRIDTFLCAPYHLKPEEMVAAIEQIRKDANYGDICATRASNGDQFLFSLNHMSKAQGESMAEWLAVGQFDNP